MRMDKLTANFQMSLAEAQSLALGQDHQFIEPVHVLKILLSEENSTVKDLLNRVGVNLKQLQAEAEAAIKRLPQVQGVAGDVHVSQTLGRVLNLMDKLAQKRQDQYISSELFVLAAVEDKGPVGDILRQAGATKQSIEKAIEEVRGGGKVNDPGAEQQRQALEKYTIDLISDIILKKFPTFALCFSKINTNPINYL